MFPNRKTHMLSRSKIIIAFLVFLLLSLISWLIVFKTKDDGFSNRIPRQNLQNANNLRKERQVTERKEEISCLNPPFPDFQERITKKPFGIYITPQNSPIEPERFSGFHTGTDFEIFSSEEKEEVPVESVCDGEILMKRYVSGYGGTLVEKCLLENQTITVVYGHLSLGSISKEVGDYLEKGESFALLGDFQKEETDGERKHLHLGIHKGGEINIKGYVEKESDLSGWLNVQNYFCQ